MSCNCSNIRLGADQGKIWVPAPSWSYKEEILLDSCIADEVLSLWHKGVQTCGSCCGHNFAQPYINPCEVEDAFAMAKIGYFVVAHKNGCFVAKPKSIECEDWLKFFK